MIQDSLPLAGPHFLVWVGVIVDVIRNPPFTLESIVESAVKTIADSQAKVVLDRAAV